MTAEEMTRQGVAAATARPSLLAENEAEYQYDSAVITSNAEQAAWQHQEALLNASSSNSLLGLDWQEATEEERKQQPERTALDVLADIRDVTRSVIEAGDLKTALTGLEIEGRHLGMFNERRELSGPGGGRIQAEVEKILSFGG